MSAAVEILREFRELVRQELNVSVRARAEADPTYFADNFTPWKREKFQKSWSDFMAGTLPGEISMLLAPREHAKTQQITVNETAFSSLRDPNFRTAIISDTSDMAKRIGRRIKSVLTSQKVMTTWGDVRGEKWSDTEFTLKGSRLDEKEATVTILSVGGPVTSGHYDRVILDDVVDLENSKSNLQRDKTWDWLRMTLLPTVARGQLWIVGTRYHWDDLYGRLQDVRQWPRGVRLRRDMAIQDDGSALWPKQYPLEVLQNLRADLGTVAFNSQYQNDAEAMKGSMFRAEFFKRYTELPVHLPLFQGCDLAIGQKSTNDYFALVTVAADRNGSIYVVGSYRGRLTFDEQFRAVKAQHDFYHKPDHPVTRIGIETNAYQAALAQKLIAKTRLPIRRIHQHKDKIARAQRLQAVFENGKIFFPVQGCEVLEEELLTFPEGRHDDLFDALEMAVSMAGHGRRPASITRKPRGM